MKGRRAGRSLKLAALLVLANVVVGCGSGRLIVTHDAVVEDPPFYAESPSEPIVIRSSDTSSLAVPVTFTAWSDEGDSLVALTWQTFLCDGVPGIHCADLDRGIRWGGKIDASGTTTCCAKALQVPYTLPVGSTSVLQQYLRLDVMAYPWHGEVVKTRAYYTRYFELPFHSQ